LLVLFALKSTQSMIGISHSSLTPELTDDYNERTSLTIYKTVCGTSLGIVAGATMSLLTFSFRKPNGEPDMVKGYSIAGLIFACILAVPPYITCFFVKERENLQDGDEEYRGFWGSLRGLKAIFTNRAFLMLTGLTLLSYMVMLGISGVTVVLYVTYVLKAQEKFFWIILINQTITTLSLFGWGYFSKRYGKQMTYYVGQSFSLVTSVIQFWIQPDQLWLFILTSSISSLGMGVVLIVPWSMLPDVMEVDELKTGKRREGSFYAIFIMIQKLAIAFTSIAVNTALAYAGYKAPDDPAEPPDAPPAVQLVLRLFVSFIPLGLIALSYIFVYFYPITQEKHEAIKEELREKKRMKLDMEDQNGSSRERLDLSSVDRYTASASVSVSVSASASVPARESKTEKSKTCCIS